MQHDQSEVAASSGDEHAAYGTLRARRRSERNEYSLEDIKVPALIVHTKDDQLASHDASERAAQRIPGTRFVSLESGGHLIETAGFIMTRRMLLGLKQRAEALRAANLDEIHASQRSAA